MRGPGFASRGTDDLSRTTRGHNVIRATRGTVIARATRSPTVIACATRGAVFDTRAMRGPTARLLAHPSTN